MTHRRTSMARPEEDSSYAERNLIFPTELLRKVSTAHETAKPEEKLSVFWRVFGGTILSIAALVFIQAYQSLASNIHEVRSDLGRVRDMQADYVKKDDFSSRTSSLWNRLQDLQSLNTAVSLAGNKLAAIEQQLTVAEKDRKEIQTAVAAFSPIRDRVGQLEDSKKIADSDHKEIMNLTVCLNAMREKDVVLQKQLKEAETERKDLIRDLQALRERLAKLEGTKTSSEGK